MRARRTVVTHVLLGIGAIGAIALGGAQPAQPAPPDAATTQAMLENYLKSIQPNEHHKFLEQFVGEWETTTRMFWDPASPLVETTGTATYRMVHAGRFLLLETAGVVKFPRPDGSVQDLPTTGLGLTGFDNNRKLYTVMWTDNLGTAIYTGKGSLTPDGTVLTVYGEMDEPMTGEVGKTVKYVTRILSPDRHVFEIHEVLYGEPAKVVEIEYVRKR
jgi:hypothetical protein